MSLIVWGVSLVSLVSPIAADRIVRRRVTRRGFRSLPAFHHEAVSGQHGPSAEVRMAGGGADLAARCCECCAGACRLREVSQAPIVRIGAGVNPYFTPVGVAQAGDPVSASIFNAGPRRAGGAEPWQADLLVLRRVAEGFDAGPGLRFGGHVERDDDAAAGIHDGRQHHAQTLSPSGRRRAASGHRLEDRAQAGHAKAEDGLALRVAHVAHIAGHKDIGCAMDRGGQRSARLRGPGAQD